MWGRQMAHQNQKKIVAKRMTLKYLQQTNGRRKKPKVRSSLFCTKVLFLSGQAGAGEAASIHIRNANSSDPAPVIIMVSYRGLETWCLLPFSQPAYYSWHSFVQKSCNMHLCSFISLPRFLQSLVILNLKWGKLFRYAGHIHFQDFQLYDVLYLPP